MRIAVFDLCGTLYRCNTLFTFTRWICPKNLLRRLGDSYWGYLADELFPQKQWRRQQHLKSLRDFEKEELCYYGQKFVREILPPLARPSALALLKKLQEDGWATLLISAAPDFLAEPVAWQMGFYEWHSSLYQNGKLKRDLTGCKEKILKEYFPWERLLVCTDNRSDEKLLRYADERVIYTSQRYKDWWLQRFDPKELREV